MLTGAGFLEYDGGSGKPYRWNTTTGVNILIDSGNASAGINATAAATIVNNVIAKYNALQGSQLTLSVLGTSSADITNTNILDYINYTDTAAIEEANSTAVCKANDHITGANLTIFFDENGAFFDDISLGTNVLGIATPTHYNAQGDILCAYLAINGKAIVTTDELEYVIAHELGHALNLSHTQINGHLTDSDPAKVPLMYPFIPSDAVAALVPTFKLDDQFSYAYLYSQNTLNMSGRISGAIKNRFGEGVFGTNVICRDPNIEENAVSWISGVDDNGEGAYLCGMLPGADYVVEVSPIKEAINVWEINPPFIPSEFYSGPSESYEQTIDNINDDINAAQSITVAGAEVPDIDVVLNEDGRLENGVTQTGTTPAGEFVAATSGQPSFIAPAVHPLPYYIYVPSNAKNVTFEINATDSSQDLDLLIRCGSPFSLSTAIAGILFDQDNKDRDQTDIDGTGNTGNEFIGLNSSSTPKIDACDYHLLVINFTDQAVGFDIVAHIEGDAPTVVFDFKHANKNINGEDWVSSLEVEAIGDRFLASEIMLTDEGLRGASDATQAKLYFDQNNNGKLDLQDPLVSQTSAIMGNEFTFSGINLYLEENVQKRYFITYQQPAAASISFWALFFILGFIVSGGLITRSQLSVGFACLCIMLVGFGCASQNSFDHDIKVLDKSDIQGETLGFGANYVLQEKYITSVEDFFN